MSACQVGGMNVSSCSTVGLRNSGAVSRMKSFQNCPASWLAVALDGLGGRREVDEVLVEAERLEPALPRRLGGEHDAVPALGAARRRSRCTGSSGRTPTPA